jgi:hypothetical protein
MNLFLKKYGKMFDNITQVTKYFKRCDLNKYRKMIRGKQVAKYFKRCGIIFFSQIAQATTLEKFNVTCFPRGWHNKNISVCSIFSNHNVWNETLLVFRVLFYRIFFQITTFEILRYLFSAYHILQTEMFLLCHPRGKQVTLNFSSVVACAICEKKTIIKKLHFLNMFFFQCLIIILEKCLSLYTDACFPSIFFPYFFQTATFEILRYLFSAYHFPVLVQTATFEILRYLWFL